VEERLPGDVRAEAEDPLGFVWMLVLGEALTPRGDLGPLARFWVPAPPPRVPSARNRRDGRAGS
jgi:hypothetical protein